MTQISLLFSAKSVSKHSGRLQKSQNWKPIGTANTMEKVRRWLSAFQMYEKKLDDNQKITIEKPQLREE